MSISVLVTAGAHPQKGLQQSLSQKIWPEAHQNQSENAMTSTDPVCNRWLLTASSEYLKQAHPASENEGQSIH